MAVRKVVPGSLTDAYKLRQGDFAPSLVGNQFTDPNAFFTLGNFSITSNFEGRVGKDFTLGEFSDYYTLNDLNVTEQELEEMSSNVLSIKLNYDINNIQRYAYFGSLTKALENEVQEIIIKWPASLYISSNPVQPTTQRPTNVNTVLDFNYNSDLNISYFKTPLGGINNPFNLNYVNSGGFGADFGTNIPSEIYNYELFNDKKESYIIQNMTGSTSDSNYVYFEIEGNPFKSLSGTTFGKKDFHIRPKKEIRNKFFNNLTDLQSILLNRLTTPIYTLTIEVPTRYDDGDISFIKKNITWPTQDGYNIDIDTIRYGNYIEELFKIGYLYDENITDIAHRRLVADSILEYDTDGEEDERTGRKISKLIRIYGAEFDVVKKYINGISFANVFTYNKKDNTSDELIKIMAKTLGFDVLLATSNGFSLLENDDPNDDPVFQGYSRSLSAKETDNELWRRLIINAWWLFRSKGTRKVLEFFMKLFGINNCLVTMDERIYLAKDKLDIFDLRRQFNTLFGPDYFDLNFNNLFVDNYGFPKVPRSTDDFWFQNDGFWYNGGNERTTGNNPHYGPYDYGQSYWDRFICLAEDFQSQIVNETVKTNVINYFTEYNSGTLTPDADGTAFSEYGSSLPEYLVNPYDNINVLSAGLVEYGTDNGPKNVRDTGDTYSLRVTFQAGESSLCLGCPPETTFGNDGIIYVNGPNNQQIPHNVEDCCDFYWLPSDQTTTPITDPINGPITEPVNPISPSINNTPKSQGFVLSMDQNTVIPSQVVDCSGSQTGIPNLITNPICIGNNCVDSSYGTLTVNPNTSVTITITLLGGATSTCCEYSGALYVNNTPTILSATAYATTIETITLGPGNYDLRLSLLSYSCGSGNISIDIEENVTIINGTEILPPDKDPPVYTGPVDGTDNNGTLPIGGGEIPPETSDGYICYWCPPNEILTLVCNSEQYYIQLGLNESNVVEYASNFGYNGNEPSLAEQFILNVFNTYFQGGKCMYMLNNKPLANKNCCEVRGGTWNPELKICESVEEVNGCSNETVISLYEVMGTPTDLTNPPDTNNFTLLDQECCNTLGYYYGGRSISVTDLDGLVYFVPPSEANNLLLVNNGNPRTACFKCPREIKENLLTDPGLVINYITDLNGDTISEECCTNYGYNYKNVIHEGQSTNLCLKCGGSGIVVNPETNTVNDSLGNSLDRSCCDAAGYYYYSGDNTQNGCYICPPFVDGSYLFIKSNLNGSVYTTVTNNQGQALSKNCCLYYRQQSGNSNVVWDANIGCFIQ